MKDMFRKRKVMLSFFRYVSFGSLEISPILSRQLRNANIRHPTDIQKLSIPKILDGKNCVINSATGSGKTLAYGIPLIQRILQEQKDKGGGVFGLILVPNNELAIQVNDVINRLSVVKSRVAAEFSPLRLKSTDIIVSTPSHIVTYPLNVFDTVKTLVIDEADFQIARKVGKHGFKDPLFNIIHHFLDKTIVKSKDRLKSLNSDGLKNDQLYETKKGTQFIFVGAIMPDSTALKSKSALPYIKSWLPSIEIIRNAGAHKLVDSVKINCIDVLPGNKFKLLTQILTDSQYINKKILVFSNRIDSVISLYKSLNYQDAELMSSSSVERIWRGMIFLIHSKQTLNERLKILNNFLSMRCGVLLSTDVISRGIDIPNVDVVIQFDFATNIVDALHRAGRTARINQQGEVISFVTSGDKTLAEAFEKSFEEKLSLENYFSRRRSLRKRLSVQLDHDNAIST